MGGTVETENKQRLGNASTSVSKLTFGGNVFGWTIDEEQSFKILDAFVGAGFNFIDTADTYSKWVPGNKGGESETIIGRWMKKNGNRDKLIIATKLGGDLGDGKKGLSASYVRQAAEASLIRLKTEYIDLYQTHYDDPQTPVSETMIALNELIDEGKVRHIGASNLSAERIKESNEFARNNNLAPYVSLQPLYNLYSRQKFEEEYRDFVMEESLAVIPYYALASGFLTGKYRTEEDLNKSARGHGIKKYLDERGKKILAALDEVAVGQNVQPAQIAIAWLLHKETVTSPIASATTIEQLNELTEAVNLKLTKDQMNRLDDASSY